MQFNEKDNNLYFYWIIMVEKCIEENECSKECLLV